MIREGQERPTWTHSKSQTLCMCMQNHSPEKHMTLRLHVSLHPRHLSSEPGMHLLVTAQGSSASELFGPPRTDRSHRQTSSLHLVLVYPSPCLSPQLQLRA